MRPKKRDVLHSEFAEFYEKHRELGKAFTVKHFMAMNVPRRTCYDLLKKIECFGKKPGERKAGSGRKSVKMTTQMEKKLIRKAQHKIGVSTRNLARQFGISQAYVRKILKKAGVTYRKRQKVPELTENQQQKQKTRLRKLARTEMSLKCTKQIVMDDESYFTYGGVSMPENQGYYTAVPRDEVPEDVRFRHQAKFQKKIMVWVAISPNGISKPFFCPSGGALNAETYQKECITKRLVPFINEKHAGEEILFWPDLASCHYARETQRLLAQEGISFVAKEDNPPCCPQLRPIEDVWAILKASTYAGGWKAKNDQQLIAQIKKSIRSMDQEVVRKMMEGVPKRVRHAANAGALACLH